MSRGLVEPGSVSGLALLRRAEAGAARVLARARLLAAQEPRDRGAQERADVAARRLAVWARHRQEAERAAVR